ncbi:folylpolyglutamate synthase [Linderina macrospora]|uniref:Folylpolyglutamate synthase n=1 Tax=Linderina macrospora TaxID=4868 RepID=A0ACC1JG16_9FUNG|nr:folylpolyglutamate synthase [Linderina macrospora]
MATDTAGKISLGLERITGFLQHGFPRDPRTGLRVVHVAGTNGKGSVCALISQALIAAGYKTGTFNSPHFLEPNDAIRIQDTPIAASKYRDLRAWINSLDEQLASLHGRLSLFEQATAAALWWFAENHVDVAVVEVGMGGLRDATNVFGSAAGAPGDGFAGQSLVQCICAIDEDHVGMIGNTIEEIAQEKAGIIRPGAWVVLGAQSRSAAFQRVRQIAQRLSPTRIINLRRQPTHDIHVPQFTVKPELESVAESVTSDAPRLTVHPADELPSWATFNGTGRRCLRARYPPTTEEQGKRRSSVPVPVPTAPPAPTTDVDLPLVLAGYYQAANAGIAFYALDVLRTHCGFHQLTDTAIQVGFQNVRWPGRLAWLRLRPTGASDKSPAFSDELGNWVLADGAHNEPAAVELRKYVDTALRRFTQQRHILAGAARTLTEPPPVRWVVGFTRGKDVAAILTQLVRPGDAVWAVPFSQPDEMPWISCTDTAEIASQVEAAFPGMPLTQFASLAAAVEQLRADRTAKCLTVLCGSLYLTADLYRELGVRPFAAPEV